MVFWMIFLSVMGLNVAVLLITFAYSSVAKFSPIEKPALIPVEVIGLIVVFLILSGFSFGISTALTAIFALLF